MSVTRGTLLLGGTTFFNRVVGFLYSVYLIRLFGTEPVGLYKLALPSYFALLSVISAGIPYAVSRRVAERKATGDQAGALETLSIALVLMAAAGIVGAAAIYAGADHLARIYADPRTALVLKAAAPGLLLMPIGSALRGYFQGIQDMAAVAAAQTVEQLAHAGVTVGLALALVDKDPRSIAVAMAAGLVAGELFSFQVLVRWLAVRRRKLDIPVGFRGWVPVIRETGALFKLAGPVALGQVATSILGAFLAFLVPARLRFGGATASEAAAIYGRLTGIALPLLFLPNIIFGALAVNLVPAMSRASTLGKKTLVAGQAARSLAFTLAAGIPSTAVLVFLARPLSEILYREPEAAGITLLVSMGAVFAYLRQTTFGILRGLARPDLQVRNSILASLPAIAVIYFLVPLPGMGVLGLGLSVVTELAAGALLNIFTVAALTGFAPDLRRHVASPLAATALCLGIGMFTHRAVMSLWPAASGFAVPAAVAAGALLYAAWFLGPGGPARALDLSLPIPLRFPNRFAKRFRPRFPFRRPR